jgi:hypothetical protein
MSNDKTNGSGPAFPSQSVEWVERPGVGQHLNEVIHSGLSLRQYAAIKLRVPDSGEEWLDEMIRKSLRDEFAGRLQADDRLVKCVRSMDDTALEVFALYPELEREEHITETGMLAGSTMWQAMSAVEKVAARLELEAKAISRVRYMQADALLKAREQ